MHKVQTLQLALQSTDHYTTDTRMISDQECHFFQSVSDWILHTCFPVQETESKACACAVLSPSDKLM